MSDKQNKPNEEEKIIPEEGVVLNPDEKGMGFHSGWIWDERGLRQIQNESDEEEKQ